MSFRNQRGPVWCWASSLLSSGIPGSASLTSGSRGSPAVCLTVQGEFCHRIFYQNLSSTQSSLRLAYPDPKQSLISYPDPKHSPISYPDNSHRTSNVCSCGSFSVDPSYNFHFNFISVHFTYELSDDIHSFIFIISCPTHMKEQCRIWFGFSVTGIQNTLRHNCWVNEHVFIFNLGLSMCLFVTPLYLQQPIIISMYTFMFCSF